MTGEGMEVHADEQVKEGEGKGEGCRAERGGGYGGGWVWRDGVGWGGERIGVHAVTMTKVTVIRRCCATETWPEEICLSVCLSVLGTRVYDGVHWSDCAGLGNVPAHNSATRTHAHTYILTHAPTHTVYHYTPHPHPQTHTHTFNT